jgi:hypothetical protein
MALSEAVLRGDSSNMNRALRAECWQAFAGKVALALCLNGQQLDV